MNHILRRVDLNLLVVFDALMQERNLTRAAQHLHMSQPAVSNALARLREQLNEPLFVRTARGMTPTTRAEVLHGPVLAALRLLQDGMAPEPAFDPPAAKQSFRLALSDYPQYLLLPALMARVHEQAPDVTLVVEPDDAETLASRLAAGTLDLAIDYLHFDVPELRYEPLFEEEITVIARLGHPALRRTGTISRKSFEAASHVAMSTRAGRGSPFEIVLGSVKVRRHAAIQVPSYLSVPAIVAQSELIGSSPRRLAERAARVLPIALSPLPFNMGPVQVSMITNRQKDGDHGLQWLKHQIVATIAQIVATETQPDLER
ncbi:MAG: LysR substrate-binding domain-containing protein [Pseudomonadota bacterium]